MIKVIMDGRILKAMSKQEGFLYPVDKPFHYVDELNNHKLRNEGFCYKGTQYIIKYMSGCFYPFVCNK